MRVIPPLKSEFKLDYDGDVPQQILDRVQSEDNFTHSRGFALTSYGDIDYKLCPRMERI